MPERRGEYTMRLSQYVWKSFRKELGKGLLVAFVLSVTLVSAVFNLATTLQETMYRDAVSMNGDVHVRYIELTEKQMDAISREDAAAFAERQYVLHNVWGEVFGDRHTGIGFVHSTRMGEVAGFRLTDGRAPEADNEVALPPHVAEILGIPAKPGESFELQLTGKADGESVQLVVSGVMEPQSYHEITDTNMLFVTKAFIDRYAVLGPLMEQSEWEPVSCNLYLRFKDGYMPQETANSLTEQYGVPESGIMLNGPYISAKLQDPALMGLVIAAVGLLMLMGALVIYNIFNIMVVKRIQEYGMLTLVGASRGQIRRCVFLESLLYVLVSLPIGFLLGTALSYLCMPLMETALAVLQPRCSVSPYSYAATAVLIALMALVGAARPAFKAAGITPVEAVKFSVRAKPVKRRRQEDQLSIPVLARLNRKRNAGRIRVTVLTLSISGILFLSLAAVGTSFMDSMEMMVKQGMDADIQVKIGEKHGSGIRIRSDWNPLTDAVLEEMRSIDGITEIRAYWMAGYERQVDSEFLETGAIAALEDWELEELLSHVEGAAVTLEDLRDPRNAVAVNDASCQYAEDYMVSAGDTVTVHPRRSFEGDTEEPFTVRIIGTIDSSDVRFAKRGVFSGNLPALLFSRESFAANGLQGKYETVRVFVEEDKQQAAAQAIGRLCEQTGELHYDSAYETVQERKRQMLGIILLVVAMIVIIAFIGILNLISTTYIGIEQRKHEFGILSALGLSIRGMKQTLLRETMWISLTTIGISSVMGLGIGYAFYRLINSIGTTYMAFSPPVLSLAVMCAVLLLVPPVITLAAVKRLLKNPAVELLREET